MNAPSKLRPLDPGAARLHEAVAEARPWADTHGALALAAAAPGPPRAAPTGRGCDRLAAPIDDSRTRSNTSRCVQSGHSIGMVMVVIRRLWSAQRQALGCPVYAHLGTVLIWPILDRACYLRSRYFDRLGQTSQNASTSSSTMSGPQREDAAEADRALLERAAAGACPVARCNTQAQLGSDDSHSNSPRRQFPELRDPSAARKLASYDVRRRMRP